jgi:hypothetical protein
MIPDWKPAICRKCGTKPVKGAWRQKCWSCTHPGVEPPPCRRCGILEYFFEGVCKECHVSSAHVARSCRYCFAWGILKNRTCTPCRTFNRKHPIGECRSCRRQIAVTDGFCRLCRCQGQLIAGHNYKTRVEPFRLQASTRQQLFLDNTLQRYLGNREERRQQKLALPSPPPVTMPTHVELVLFDANRDLTRFDPTTSLQPDNPQLMVALRAAQKLAERNGWTAATRSGVERGASRCRTTRSATRSATQRSSNSSSTPPRSPSSAPETSSPNSTCCTTIDPTPSTDGSPPSWRLCRRPSGLKCGRGSTSSKGMRPGHDLGPTT